MVHRFAMTEETQMKIRLPQALKAQIEASAVEGSRSLNAEIVYRLQSSFPEINWGAENLQRRAMKQTSLASSGSLEREIETLRAQLRLEESERVRLREEVTALINSLDHRVTAIEKLDGT